MRGRAFATEMPLLCVFTSIIPDRPRVGHQHATQRGASEPAAESVGPRPVAHYWGNNNGDQPRAIIRCRAALLAIAMQRALSGCAVPSRGPGISGNCRLISSAIPAAACPIAAERQPRQSEQLSNWDSNWDRHDGNRQSGDRQSGQSGQAPWANRFNRSNWDRHDGNRQPGDRQSGQSGQAPWANRLANRLGQAPREPAIGPGTRLGQAHTSWTGTCTRQCLSGLPVTVPVQIALVYPGCP